MFFEPPAEAKRTYKRLGEPDVFQVLGYRKVYRKGFGRDVSSFGGYDYARHIYIYHRIHSCAKDIIRARA